MKAQIHWNEKKEKYELVSRGVVLVSSGNEGYLNYLVKQQKHSKIRDFNVTEAEVISRKPETGIMIMVPGDTTVAPQAPQFSINERFEFMEQLINMVIGGHAKSMLVSGEGGVGKTYTVLDCLKKAGKVDTVTVVPTIEDIIGVDDSEEEMEEKVLAQINRPRGDYTVIKGKVSPKALYRLLYENRNHMIVFDDCDSVLRDDNALNLLKAALDSYDDRWVSWRSEQAFGESDLPQSFKFNGSIIFISNMPLPKIDEAVRTRCFKVDLSMTKKQRIERMRAVLEYVMEDVEMEPKVEALDLIEENLELTNDVNFRTLMNLITIRLSGNSNWKKLALYALTEQ